MKVNFLGRGQTPGHSPGSKRFLGHENPLKMHILSIDFISFTAQIFIMHCICKAKKSDFGILGGHGPLGPPESAYVFQYGTIPPTRLFNYQVLILVYKQMFTFFALLPIC